MQTVLPVRSFLAILACGSVVAACAQGAGYQQNPNTYKGAGAGAAIGGLLGSMESSEYAAGGAALGALAGGAIGQYMDRQEAAMRSQLQGTGIGVERQGDNLLLNIPNNVTFDFDSARIWAEGDAVLKNVAGVMVQYPQTMIDVVGHTDNKGTDAYNEDLSVRRAQAVANKLRDYGVASERLMVLGKGESQPIATNDTEEGRARNRRVEVRVSPITR